MNRKCKFCGCTDERACRLPVSLTTRGLEFADDADDLSVNWEPCYWVIPGVCSNPECVEKAYAVEGRIILAPGVELRFG